MLQIVSKYQNSEGKFVVIAQESEPMLTIMPAVFDEDKSHLTNAELLDEVLNYNYQRYFVGKFANETAQQVDKLNEKMAEVDEWLAKAKETMSEIEKTSELSQGSIIEMSEMIFDHEIRIGIIEGGNSVV